jgi:hypothetical protein
MPEHRLSGLLIETALAMVDRIAASAREQGKVRHFGQKSWLYVMTEGESDKSELHRIQDPAAHFREGEDFFATGFIVHEETWRERSKSR